MVPWEDTHGGFAGLFAFWPAAVLLLSGNSEWHSGDAAGLPEYLPAVLFIITVKGYLASEHSIVNPSRELNLDIFRSDFYFTS